MKEPTYHVFLESDEYGREYFDALDGWITQLERVHAGAVQNTREDGIVRRVGVEVRPFTMEDPE